MKKAVQDLLSSDDGNLRKMGIAMAEFDNFIGIEREFVRLVNDSDPNVRNAAVAALGKLQGTETEKRITAIALNESEDPSIRDTALKTIMDWGGAHIVKNEIRQRLHHHSRDTRMGAIKAIERVGDEEFYEDLIAVFCVGDFTFCEAAARAIVEIKRHERQELYELFILLLEEEEEAQKYGAIVGLGEIADRRAMKKLADLSREYNWKKGDSTQSRMAEAIVEAFEKMGAVSRSGGTEQSDEDIEIDVKQL